MAQTRTAEVVIIGGGVTGASTAFHLTQRGRSRRGGRRQGHAGLRRHGEELGLRAAALLHGRDLPDDPVLARVLPALRRARRRRVVRVPPHRLPARRRQQDARAHGGLGRAAALGRHRHAAGVAHRDARDRAAAARGRLRGRLLRARLGLLQPGRDRPGVRPGRPRGGRAHPGGHRRRRACWSRATASAASAPRRGDIHAPVVLNAAGLWSAPVAAMAGVDLPIHVCRHKISIVTWPRGRAAAAPDVLRLRHQHLHAPGDGRAHPRRRPRRRGVARRGQPRRLQGRASAWTSRRTRWRG